MDRIHCYDERGRAFPVAAKDVQFRPAVYGIYIEGEQVLLLRQAETDLWYPPGSILEAHQAPAKTIRRHLRQVTGVMLRLGPLLRVEDQYRIDQAGQAWHLSVLYYSLDRPPLTSIPQDEQGIRKPASWLALTELKREQMRFGYEAVMAGRLRLQLLGSGAI